MNRLLEVIGLAVFGYLFVMVCLFAAGHAATRPAHESRRYVCVQRYHGDTFAPNRRNILRGFCAVSTRG